MFPYKHMSAAIAQYPLLIYFNLHVLPLLYVCIVLVFNKKTIKCVIVEQVEYRQNSKEVLIF